MSKILLEKINNILDIDKNKEYINQSEQQSNEFINLCLFATEQEINELFNNNKCIHTFNEDYEKMLEYVNQINDYETLAEFIKAQNFDDLELSIEQFNPDNLERKQTNYQQNEEVNRMNEFEILKQENYLYNKFQVNKEFKEYLLKETRPFKALNKLAMRKFVETGKQLLKLATTFIEGNINKQYIKAPLFLFDLEIDIQENKVIFTKKPELILNEKLIIFLAKQLEMDYKELKLAEIRSLNDFKAKFEPFLKYEILTEDALEGATYNNGVYRTLKAYPTYLIGLFDVKPSKLKDDFINIINQNVDLFNQKMKHDFEYYTNQEFVNNALAQVNKPLNIYQKYALRSSINENTLIYGPPGTGKSEIIATIAANLLINAKSILIVSEKDAALNVLKSRLKDLAKFAFFLKDIEDEKGFYEQIQSISQYMGTFYNKEENQKIFDIYQQYEDNDRVKDYNQAINKFRKIIQEDIDFSLEKDSRNNDYRDYLLSIIEVNKFIDNNKQEVEEFWSEYKNKYVKQQSATEFIAKVAEYNDFREHYELTEEEVNKFEQFKIDINKFFAEYDVQERKEMKYDELNKDINALSNFINNALLIKDKDFIDAISNEYDLLEKHYTLFKEINEILEPLKNKYQVLKFIITNCSKHDKFMATYLKTSKELQPKLIARYFFKREISTKNMVFKSIKNNDFNHLFIKALQIFSKIKVFKTNDYLFELIKLDKKILKPINVLFYTKPQMFKKSIVEYHSKQIINFDNRIIKQYYKHRINQIERELININVYRYEKIIKNKHIIDRDFAYLINRYLDDNKDFILNMDEAISQTYLKYLKFKLSTLTPELQAKMEKMFKIVNLELKPKINDFIIEFIDCLRVIFPIWISKPDLISFYLKNEPGLFDVGIFDEASQMFLERAYPMLYRCKQYIIAGDDKQLKPERMSFNELDSDPDYRPLVKEVEFDYSESLLDRAKVSYWNTYYLRNHYRSQAKELIEFSNDYFYDNKLLFSSINFNPIYPSLEIINIQSEEVNGININQAIATINLIKQNINFNKILVICFTNEQKEQILSFIKDEYNDDINSKIKHGNLVIGDISSVQGDEGDLVIICSVFTKESKDYGLITEPRGMNYLNVAITRAKEKMIVVKSIFGGDVKLKPDNAYEDDQIFKKWIMHLDRLQERQSSNDVITIADNKISKFKKEVYEYLNKDSRFNNYFYIIQNLSIGSSPIDVAFISSGYINNIDLALILDDWKKNIDIQSWFEDIDHEEYLKARNYKILRIREQDWLLNKEKVLDNIYHQLKPIIDANQVAYQQEGGEQSC